MTDESPVVVTMVMGTFAADVIKAALEDAGIPAVTRGEQHSSWLFAGSGGGLGPRRRCWSRPTALDEARAVACGAGRVGRKPATSTPAGRSRGRVT